MVIHIILIYIYSRIIYYYVFGIFFNSKPLIFAVQYLDPELLRNNLLQSLFYLHSQPPLFNLFLGAGLKLFPGNPVPFYHYSFMILGLLFTVALYLLMVRLNISKRIAFILTVIFIINPAFILYENFLFYTHPVLVLLLLSAFFLNSYLKYKSSVSLVLFFSVISAAALIQSFFHLFWIMLIVIMLSFLRKKDVKRILIASSVPLLIVASVYLKNYFVFGEFAASSWLGMNFSKITTFQLPGAVRDSLYKAGKTSYLSTLYYFPDINNSKFDIGLDTVSTGIKALDEMKKTTGRTNFNNINYIGIAKTSLKDAITVIKYEPSAYFRGIEKSVSIFFESAGNYPLLGWMKKKLRLWPEIFNGIFYGQFGSRKKDGWFTILFFPLLIIFGIYLTFNKRKFDPETRFTVGYMVFTVIYVSVIGILLDVGENNRFRYVIDPFMLILFGLLINYLFRLYKGSKFRVKEAGKDLTA